MEKSIETIWKEGFLNNDALLAPKLNNLYNQKSIDIVEKFKRIYKINRIAIVVYAFLFLAISFVVNIPYMGIGMFILFNAAAIVAQKFSNKLNKINKTASSYQYLISFDNWVKEMIAVNTTLSRYFYPYIFMVMVAGFWFGSIGGDVPGDQFVDNIISEFPNTYLVFGFPLLLIIAAIVIIGALAFFGGKIGKWDLNLVYGRILRKLDNTLADMDELRN